MKKQNYILTVLGSSGGVAKAILAILNRCATDTSDPIHTYLKDMKIHLVDRKQKDKSYYKSLFPHLKDHFTIHQLDLKNIKDFKQHLKKTKTTHVIDVSWADTVKMLKCCNELGVHYINTALENTKVDENEDLEGFTLMERYLIFEKHKDRFNNMTGIIGSGMNPGVVQWMALETMKQFPGENPKGCYIVERDNSCYKDKTLLKPKTIYSTWSPECFLDEAILNFPMYVSHHTPLFLYEDVYSIEFKVNLGEKQFFGCLMPHEEVLTLGKLFDMEIGFIYRVNDYTTDLIRSNLKNVDDLWEWKQKVLDPAVADMEGEDLVGVLLVYEDKEYYMYNVMGNEETYLKYKVNATYFQVACGIYGALASLLLDSLPSGVYYVDELLLLTNSKYGQYLSYYMNNFVTGMNEKSDGLLLKRIKNIESSADMDMKRT